MFGLKLSEPEIVDLKPLKRVSWNKGKKGCFNEETLKKISEGVRNSGRLSLNHDLHWRKRQSEIMKNSEAARIAREKSRDKAEATKRLPGGYYDQLEEKKKAKTEKKKAKTRKLQGDKGGKGNRKGVPIGTPLMTPDGLFESRAAYIRFTGLSGATISGRIKNYPQQYFYVEKNEKRCI